LTREEDASWKLQRWGEDVTTYETRHSSVAVGNGAGLPNAGAPVSPMSCLVYQTRQSSVASGSGADLPSAGAPVSPTSCLVYQTRHSSVLAGVAPVFRLQESERLRSRSTYVLPGVSDEAFFGG
jgi:hypothetical protein